MTKLVLKLEVYDEKIKQRALKRVSGIRGVDSVEINMKDQKLTLTGEIDPVTVVSKLRKLCGTQILTVGPAKEEKKKDDPPKKNEPKKDDDNKKKDEILKVYPIPPYYYQYQTHPMYTNYYRPVVEDHPPGCVIC